MDTLMSGRCLLFNYTSPVRKGASLSLHFRPSEKLEAFSAYFLDDDNIATAALDANFKRFKI